MILLEFNALMLITRSMALREVINGAIFVLCMNLAGLLVYFMIRTYREVPFHKWRHEEGMDTACVLGWVFGIIGLRSGLVWYALRLANDGEVFSSTLELVSNWSLIVSAVILCAVTLRATYIWTPPAWHNKAWIVSGVLAILFLVISEYL